MKMRHAERIIAAAVFTLLSVSPVDATAGEDLLWPQYPVRIDRSKQTYERLPPVQTAIDSRTWLIVPVRIKVPDSASFIANGQIYRMKGIHPVDAGRICKGGGTGRWPCGRMSAIYFGNLVRGKRVLCNEEIVGDTHLLSACQVGPHRIAEAVIAAGFGVAVDDAALSLLEAKARQDGKGLWRDPGCEADFDHC